MNCRGGPSATRGRKQNGFASGQSRGPRRRGAGLPLTGDCAARLSTRRARLAQGQQPHVVEDPGPVRVLPGIQDEAFDVLQAGLFFGYMALVALGVALVAGAAGFLASLKFLAYIFAQIKFD